MRFWRRRRPADPHPDGTGIAIGRGALASPDPRQNISRDEALALLRRIEKGHAAMLARLGISEQL